MVFAALSRALPSGIQRKLKNDPRLARLVHGSASSVIGRGMGMVVSAITLPLTIRYLGRDEYGIWITISTTVVMLAVLDLGISSTLINFIAKSHAEDNKQSAQHYFASAFWITAALASMLACLGAVLWRYLPWASLFNIKDAVIQQEASRCVAISFGFFLLNLPLSLGNRVLGGYQEVQISNYFAMFSNVLGLVAIVGGVWAKVSLSGLMLCYCIAILSGNLFMNLWLWFWGKPWLRPSPWAIRMSLSSELFGEGFLFFILQIAGLVVFNSDNLVITHYLGAGAVTPYSVAARLMGYAALLQSLLIPAMWPAFSDAYHKGELGWVRLTYRRVYRGTVVGVAVLALLLTACGQWIIRVWATRAAVPSLTLLATMGIWAVVLSVSTNQASLLAATQRLKLQAVAATLAAICNLAGSILLVRRMGPVGVMLATIVSYLVFIILPQGWEVRNVLRGRYRSKVHAA